MTIACRWLYHFVDFSEAEFNIIILRATKLFEIIFTIISKKRSFYVFLKVEKALCSF
jgi:hypothetical protein